MRDRAVGYGDKTGAAIGRMTQTGEEPGTKLAFFVLLLFVTLEFVRPQYYVPAIGVIRPSLLTALLLAFLWMKTFGLSILRDPLIRMCFVFLFLTALMVPFATNNYVPFKATQELGIIMVCGTIPLALLLRHADRLQRFLTLWVIIHCYLAVFALTHSGFGPEAFLFDENDMALALIMAFPYSLYLALQPQRSKSQRFLLLGAALLLVAGIVATNSRGGFVAFVVLVLYLLWHSKKKVRNLALVAVAGAVSLFFVPTDYIEEMRTISNIEDGTRQDRLLHWQISWKVFTNNPIFGAGAGNYPYVADTYQRMLDTYVPGDRIESGRANHSVYFSLLAEYGTVGSVLFVLLVISFFRRLGNRGPPADQPASRLDITLAVRASMVGFLAAGAFLSVLGYPEFWFTVGLAAAVRPHAAPRDPKVA